VAANLSDEGTEYGGDVNGSQLVVIEVIFRDDENGDCDVVTDDPGEGEEVVDRGDEDRQFGDGD